MDTSLITDIRIDNDITQSEMSNILMVKRPAYSLWELGINTIPLKNLIDFSNYFNINIDYILKLTNSKYRNYKIIFDLKKLGDNLKKLRKKNELSQENMGTILNVTQAAINKYEKGVICISTINIYMIAKKFNVSIDELLI